MRVELGRGVPDPLVDQEAVLRAARRWAAELKQVSVGTEHLLLALIESGGVAGRFLETAGVRASDARATTERLFLTVRRRSGEIEPPLG